MTFEGSIASLGIQNHMGRPDVLPSGGNGPRNGAFHHRGTTITPLTANGEKWFAEAA